MDPEALYINLGRLIEAAPDLTVNPQPPATTQWLARAYALVSNVNVIDAEKIRDAMGWIASDEYSHSVRKSYSDSIFQILHRSLAVAELSAPATAQGTFIPAGSSFDALAAIGKVLSSATNTLLIVDPYMDEKVLTHFSVLAPEKVNLNLLADRKTVKPGLQPAAAAWSKQYGSQRPLEARLALPGTLHDRLIVVDNKEVWVLTQSFNAFAARAPATIVRTDDETSVLKVAAYSAIWSSAAPI
jgi:hypothetical protein